MPGERAGAAPADAGGEGTAGRDGRGFRPGRKWPELTPEQAALVADHDWVALWVAARYGRWSWVSYEDVLGWARAGLVRAAHTYDPARSKFSTYATWWVRAFVKRFLSEERGRGVAVPEYVRGCPVKVRGLTLTVGGEELDGAAGVPDGRAPLQHPLLRAWFDEDYRRQRACLDPRSRLVLCLRYVWSLTLEEVGGLLGVTRERVRQIEERAKEKLARFRRRDVIERQLAGKPAG